MCPGYFLIIVTDCWALRGQRLSCLHLAREPTGASPEGMTYFYSQEAVHASKPPYSEHPTYAPTVWEGATYRGPLVWEEKPEGSAEQICNSFTLLFAPPCSPGPRWVLASS